MLRHPPILNAVALVAALGLSSCAKEKPEILRCEGMVTLENGHPADKYMSIFRASKSPETLEQFEPIEKKFHPICNKTDDTCVVFVSDKQISARWSQNDPRIADIHENIDIERQTGKLSRSTENKRDGSSIRATTSGSCLPSSDPSEP